MKAHGKLNANVQNNRKNNNKSIWSWSFPSPKYEQYKCLIAIQTEDVGHYMANYIIELTP